MLLVRYGDRGVLVRDVQVLVNNLSAITPRLVEDGIFGPKTVAGVRQFQQKSGLVADGIVGPRTGLALLQSLSRRLRGS